MAGTISSQLGRIFIHNEFSMRELPQLLAAMHNTVKKKGFEEVELDFSSCSAAFGGSMLAVAAQSQRYLRDGIDISLTLPTNYGLKRLFLNTNWANLIDFRKYPESTFRGYTQVPAIKYSDGIQQHKAVEEILRITLSALSNFDRSHLRAIEWSINEVTDNVLNHAESPTGGFVQVTNFRQRQQLEFSVCDAGIGVPVSLRRDHPEIPSDHEALDKAIREGVTRDAKFGQGNGLYGTWQICELSNGRFEIHSGYASLISTQRDGLHVRSEQIPFSGTLVTARIGYGEPLELGKALTFEGKQHTPVDYLDLHYDEDEQGNVKFVLKDESVGFGSRAAGEPVRRTLVNLSNMNTEGKIIIEFSGIPLVSSSYADEVFGKLFVELGPLKFASQFEFRSVDSVIRNLIDRAITQRVKG